MLKLNYKNIRRLLRSDPTKLPYDQLIRLPLYCQYALQFVKGKRTRQKLQDLLAISKRELKQWGVGSRREQDLKKLEPQPCVQAGANQKEDAMSDKGEDGVVTAKRFCGDCYGPVLSGEKECFKCGSTNVQLAPVIEEQAEIKACKDICKENPPAFYGNFGCPLPARV